MRTVGEVKVVTCYLLTKHKAGRQLSGRALAQHMRDPNFYLQYHKISSHIPLNATHWAPDRIRRPPPAFAPNQYAEREGWQESAARTVTNTSKLRSRPC